MAAPGGREPEGVLIPMVIDENATVKPGETHVHILPSDLPDDEAEAEAQFDQILSVLQGEIVHPHYWMEVAVRQTCGSWVVGWPRDLSGFGRLSPV